MLAMAAAQDAKFILVRSIVETQVSRLDPEYIGNLPPGGDEELKRSLREYCQLAKDEIVRGVKILSGPGCAVAKAQEGTVYPVDRVPDLPLPDCNRAPCCGCCYSAVTTE